MTEVNTEGISPEEELIEVPIGGLLTPVYKMEWEADAAAVEAKVLKAREDLRLGDEVEAAPDYDATVAQLGEDGEPEPVDEVEEADDAEVE